MTSQTTEELIHVKGLTAPRVTPQDIEDQIVGAVYFTAQQGYKEASGIQSEPWPELSLLTFCVLVLKNGFTVTGESACASPANFDAEIGRKIARENAVRKIWPLLGYELRSRLSEPAIASKAYIVDPILAPTP